MPDEIAASTILTGNAGKTVRVLVQCKINATVWYRFFRAGLYSAGSGRSKSCPRLSSTWVNSCLESNQSNNFRLTLCANIAHDKLLVQSTHCQKSVGYL